MNFSQPRPITFQLAGGRFSSCGCRICDASAGESVSEQKQEIAVAMALLGATSLAELNRSFLHFGAPVVTQPHVHSAFPLLYPYAEAPRA